MRVADLLAPDGGTWQGWSLRIYGYRQTTAPSVTTASATNVTRTTATLNGIVNPNATSTTATFQYGLNTGYGSLIAATPAPGAGSSPVAVSAAVGGLVCGTNYHFRAVATNSAGTVNGSDQTLTTVSCPVLFTDDPLVPSITPIRAVHITELRSRIDALRTRNGLAAAVWTDPVLTGVVTSIRTVHISELRAALLSVYAVLGRSLPTFTDSTLVPGVTTMKVAHIAELRAAVTALE